MPKTKFQREPQFERLTALVNGMIFVKHVSIDGLAKMMNVSKCTASAYKKDIGRMKMEDALRLCKNLDIPIESVREAIRY